MPLMLLIIIIQKIIGNDSDASKQKAPSSAGKRKVGYVKKNFFIKIEWKVIIIIIIFYIVHLLLIHHYHNI